jgi:3-oxoacyl-[acyl-carrier protein] reductase
MIVVTPRSVPLAVDIANALATLDLGVALIDGSTHNPDAVREQFDAVDETVSSVLHVAGPNMAVGEQALVATNSHDWEASCESVLRSCLFTLQAAYRSFDTRAGSIVVVTPTLGISGAAGAVAFATAIEGVRSMCKSAARQWGKDDVTVNLIAVPMALFSPALGGLTSHQSPPARGRLPEIATDVTSAIQLFLSPKSRGITGSTVVVDGGSVMAP